jgi:hypothetical protein
MTIYIYIYIDIYRHFSPEDGMMYVFSETSVPTYEFTLRHNPEERCILFEILDGVRSPETH